MATLGTFVAGQVLTAAELNALGTYTSYTPTVGVWTLGNGTVTGRYVQLNKLIIVEIGFTFGSTSVAAATAISFTLPVTAASAGATGQLGIVGAASDNSAGTFAPLMAGFGSTTTVVPYILATVTQMNNSGLTTTSPWTWATSDTINLGFAYRAA